MIISAFSEVVFIGLIGELAQLGERLVCNQEVAGSIPVFSKFNNVRLLV